MVFTIITVLLTVFAIFVLYFKWVANYWIKNNVYTPPKFFLVYAKDILLGKENLSKIAVKVYKGAKERGERYGGFYLLAEPVFVPVDINLLKDIMLTDFQYFTDRASFLNEKNDPVSTHLINSIGAKWKSLRKIQTPFFTSGKLKKMFQTVVNCTEKIPLVFDQAIKSNEPIDMKDTVERYMTDAIVYFAFGINCNSMTNPENEFRKYGKRIFEVGLKDTIIGIINRSYPKLLKFFGLKLVKDDVEGFLIQLVREIIKYRQSKHVQRNDIIQLFIDKAYNCEYNKIDDSNTNMLNDHNRLTEGEITGQVFGFFAAGIETSSTTLSFLMYEIAQNTEIQDRLRKESEEVLEKYNNIITYEGIMEMTYLDMCVHEALRKYPAVPGLPRFSTKDYKVSKTNLIIKKGTLTIIPVYAVHHDAEYYPEPEKFNPERFSEECKSKRPPFSFLAFGEGPRVCIAQRMGILLIKTGLVAMLKDYKFSLNSKTKVPLKFVGRHFILKSDGGFWIDVKKI